MKNLNHDKKKDELYQDQAKERVKNRAAAVLVSGVVAVGTALVLFSRGCGSSAPAPMIETIRNDGVCHEELEAYPFLRDHRTGAIVRDDHGNPVPNPNYSKADCFRGDGVCDNVPDASQLRDPAGNPVQGFPQTYRDGRPIRFPLEDETSRDCVMQQVREHPCGPLEGEHAQPELTRPRLTSIDTTTPLVQRPQQQIEQMHLHPETVSAGNNYFVLPNGYQETCDANLALCDPNMEVACYCPNHPDCRPQTCGNHVRDQGEVCDGTARPTGCTGGQVCNGTCTQCVTRRRREDPCGNGTIDRGRGEVCDPAATPNGCGANQRCSANCRQCVSEATHSVCRNNQCATAPGAGSDECQSDSDCAPPPPQHAGPCPDSDGVRDIRRDIISSFDGAADTFRRRLNATDDVAVVMTAGVSVDGNGVVTGVSGVASCVGTCSPPSVGVTSVVPNLVTVGSSIGIRPGVACTISVSRRAAANR
jgi:hypothetical protein